MSVEVPGTLEAVTPEQLKVAFSGPSYAANKFFITIGQTGVRIAFTEITPNSEDVSFRTSVTMHPLDAIQLRRVLSLMLKDFESTFVESGAMPPESTGNV